MKMKNVEMKMTTIHNEMIDSKIKHVVHWVDSALDRRRGRKRDTERERERERKWSRGRERRDRE